MVNVESLLLDRLYEDRSPKIAIVTGETSVVDQDFFNQLDSSEYYDLEIIRVNFGTKTELLEVITNWDKNVDLLAFVRGGGSGLSLFDEEDLCNRILELSVPIVTAIGHEVDQQLLSKIADRSFATPSAFGAFLEKLVGKDRERREEVSILEHRIDRVQQAMDEKLGETKRSYEDRLKRANRRSSLLVVVLIAIVVFGLLYFR